MKNQGSLCCYNHNGHLLRRSWAGDNVYSQAETTIAGGYMSAFFIGNGPPLNTPNIQILEYEYIFYSIFFSNY